MSMPTDFDDAAIVAVLDAQRGQISGDVLCLTCDYNLRTLDAFCKQVCVPQFMTIAEDMSYNHGPMLSKELFDEFLAPYYKPLTAAQRSS